jgi:hypothetical protein
MKIARAANRRSFNVAPAGYFNVLRPNARFTALRLPRSFRYLAEPVAERLRAASPDYAGRDEKANTLQIMLPGTQERSVLRPALIVLAAVAITLGFFQFLKL